MSLTPSTPGQKGFLVISMDTGAVLSSGGDLQVGLTMWSVLISDQPYYRVTIKRLQFCTTL